MQKERLSRRDFLKLAAVPIGVAILGIEDCQNLHAESSPDQLITPESTDGSYWPSMYDVGYWDVVKNQSYYYKMGEVIQKIKYSHNVTAVGFGFETHIPIGKDKRVGPNSNTVSEDWFSSTPEGSYQFRYQDFMTTYGEYMEYLYNLSTNEGFNDFKINIEYRVIQHLDPSVMMCVLSDLTDAITCNSNNYSLTLVNINYLLNPLNNSNENKLIDGEILRFALTHEFLHSTRDLNGYVRSYMDEAFADAFAIDYYTAHPLTPLYDKQKVISIIRTNRAKLFFDRRQISNKASEGYEHSALVSQLMRKYQYNWQQVFANLKASRCHLFRLSYDEILQIIFPNIDLEEAYVQYLGQALLDPGVGDADLFDHVRQMRQDNINLLEIGFPDQTFTLQPGEFKYIAFDTTSIRGDFTPQLKVTDELLAGMLIEDEQRIVRVHNGTLFREKDEGRHVGFVIYNHGESDGTVVMTAFDLRSLTERTHLPNILNSSSPF